MTIIIIIIIIIVVTNTIIYELIIALLLVMWIDEAAPGAEVYDLGLVADKWGQH